MIPPGKGGFTKVGSFKEDKEIPREMERIEIYTTINLINLILNASQMS